MGVAAGAGKWCSWWWGGYDRAQLAQTVLAAWPVVSFRLMHCMGAAAVQCCEPLWLSPYWSTGDPGTQGLPSCFSYCCKQHFYTYWFMSCLCSGLPVPSSRSTPCVDVTKHGITQSCPVWGLHGPAFQSRHATEQQSLVLCRAPMSSSWSPLAEVALPSPSSCRLSGLCQPIGACPGPSRRM